MFDESDERTLLEKVQRLQDSLVAFSTGDQFDGSDSTYQRLRRELLERADIRDKVPEFVRRDRDLGQFWQLIKFKFGRYAERREFIWASFRLLIDYLEALDRSPGVQPISITLEAFDPDTVHAAWQKALDRRIADPEGAINSCADVTGKRLQARA